jgi:hypothetical protein
MDSIDSSEAGVDVTAWAMCHTLQRGGVSRRGTRTCNTALEGSRRACTWAARGVRFIAASCYSGPSEVEPAWVRLCSAEGAAHMHGVTLQRGPGRAGGWWASQRVQGERARQAVKQAHGGEGWPYIGAGQQGALGKRQDDGR